MREFKPEKIILFGSHAYGQPTPESDLDVMVVMQFEGDPLEQAVTMLNRLNMLIPIDLLVRTPEQIQQRLEMDDSFMRDIIERGKVMYEAHHACMVALRESQGAGSDQLSSGNPAMP